MYRSKKQRENSNALTRRKQDLSAETNDLRKKHQRQIVLKNDQLDQNIKQALALCVLIRFVARRKNELRTRSNDDQNDEDINDLRTRSKNDDDADDSNRDENISNDLRTRSKNDDDEDTSNDLRTRSKNDDDKSSISEEEDTSSLLTMIREVFEQNNTLIEMKQAKEAEERKSSQKALKNDFKLFMKDLIIENNLLYLKEKLIVLFFDKLRFRILRRHHDSSIERHFDYKVMFHAMFNNYF
jgi:hypothetical protein